MSEPHRRVYLDHNATAPLRPAARDAMVARLQAGGNASSVHAEGRAARAALEAARGAVGALAGVAADRVVFTSGATEAAALALSPAEGSEGRDPPVLLVGATEHPAVRRGHRYAADRVVVLPVDGMGRVDLQALETALRQHGPAMVALQAANGETGVCQPVAEAAALVHAAGGLLVCDAVQAAGRIDITPAALGADMVLLSGHKIGGPPGVGAVVLARPGLRLAPMLRGGGQEGGLRAGTENGPAIAGFGAAAAAVAGLDEAAGLAALRDRLEAGLLAAVDDLVIFGAGAPRLPNTTAIAVPGLRNETVMIGLDLAGFAVSTGSACASGKVSRSEVLDAMGIDPHLNSGLVRISLGWSTTAADVDGFVAVFAEIVRRMRASTARAA